MIYKVELSETFKKEVKRLSKKYPSLKKELAVLFTELENNPTKGIPLGNDIFKIRFSISSKGKGKSGGARIISFLKIVNEEVVLLTIYNKGDRDSISDKEIQELLSNYL